MPLFLFICSIFHLSWDSVGRCVTYLSLYLYLPLLLYFLLSLYLCIYITVVYLPTSSTYSHSISLSIVCVSSTLSHTKRYLSYVIVHCIFFIFVHLSTYLCYSLSYVIVHCIFFIFYFIVYQHRYSVTLFLYLFPRYLHPAVPGSLTH